MTLSDLSDERGTTLAELLVGMLMGCVVLIALTSMIIVTLHGNARVDARVEATDNARVGIARIVEELHSACISPQVAPVQGKGTLSAVGSTANTLIFWHASAGQGTAVQPTPVKTTISYGSGSLTQTDYAQTGGTSPKWTFSATGTEQTLLANVSPPSGSSGIFTYYKYENGSLVRLTATELSEAEAATVLMVKVALAASPKSSPVVDAGSTATVSDSATLRLTPPSYNEKAMALPCQ